MAEFVINADVTTAEPNVEVTVSRENPIALGRQRFRLIVVDDAGNRSVADEVLVIVADQENPTAVLRAPRITPFGAASSSMALRPPTSAAAGWCSTSGRISDRIGSADTGMARFPLNTPITTREPEVTVDAGLEIGRHRFRLAVIDREGRTSLPHEQIVEVQRVAIDPRPPAPAPIDPTRPVIVRDRATSSTGPPVVSTTPRPRGRGKKENP